MTVNSPRGQDAFGEASLPRSPDVIHDLVAAVLSNRFANARGDVIERRIPGGLFPFAFAAFARALERIKNAVGIVNLVERCRTFSAIASARPRMLGIAFKLLNLASDLVDVSKQTAGRLAVEAGCWD